MLPTADASPEERPLTEASREGIGDRIVARWIWALILAGLGVVDAWGSRYNLNPDGISYIEMAQHALAGAPDGFINGYWSPGYPALIAPLLSLVGHDWVTSIPLLHVVNFVMYLGGGLLFACLLRATASAGESITPAHVLVRYRAALGVAAYAIIAIKCIGLGLLTPDFGVMLAVLATAGCCLQLERTTRPLWWSVGLGVALGVGYWMKGILLPLNALLLLGLCIVPPRIDRARSMVGIAAAAFMLVSLPLVVMVSSRVGRVTMGEVGRLNYAWEVDGVTPFISWTGDSSSAQHGAPVHPPRILQAQPQTLEFATPITATYALWFDPSYWYAGVRAHLEIAGQWRVLLQGMQDLWLLVQQQLVLVVGVLALFFASARGPKRATPSRVPLVLAAWSVAATGVYALVHVEPRYLAGFIGVGLIVAWSALVRRTPRRAMPWVMGAVVIALLVSTGENVIENTGGFQAAYRPDYLRDAEKLRADGIARGDHVAMVGDAFEAYVAFGAGTPISVQVVDSTGFWQLTPDGRLQLQRRIAGTGVKALLANNIGAELAAEGWRIYPRADSTNLGVLLLAPR